MRRVLSGLPIAALSVAACLEPAAAPAGPTILSATVVRDSGNALIAWVHVRAVGFDSASVRFSSAGVPPRTSPAYGFADSAVRVPVLGLRASRTYVVQVQLFSPFGPVLVESLAVETGVLPAWVPPIGAQGTDTVPGVVLLSLPEGAVAVDNDGAVVWYRSHPGGVLSSFQAHPDGRYTVLGNTDTLRRFRVLDEAGREVATIGCVDLFTRFHSVRVEADGSWWVLCDEDRVQDLSALGGEANATVTWTVLQHVSATGDLLFDWHSADHFQFADIPPALRAGSNVNATHGNGIEFDRDGAILLSFRSLNEITKISPVSGNVIWRFGGLGGQFTIVNDARGGVAGQHGIRVAGPAQIQVLDNGQTAPSRLVRYQLDPDSGVALLVMDVRDGMTFTPVGGATQAYPDGGGLVTFGRAGRVLEVDAIGRRTWELTGLDGVYVFRAQRLPSLYGRDFGRPIGSPLVR